MIKSDNITVKPDKIRLVNLLEEVERGIIKVPEFQRDFVWNEQQMKELFDSILRGYPIGSLLLWKPVDKFKCENEIGPYEIEDESGEIKYVLDGFQRITTLFGVLTNPKKFGINEDDPKLKKFSINFDLVEEEFTSMKEYWKSIWNLIPLYKVIDTYEFLGFLNELQSIVSDKKTLQKLIDSAKRISKQFYDYEIPYVEIKGGDIKSSVEIFSRVNSKGTEISEDFMLSALTYKPNPNNPEMSFLLSDKISIFLNDMNVYNFSNLKRDVVFNCIASATDKIYFDVKFENLAKRKDIDELTHITLINLQKAIKFLYQRLYVVDYKLLPYHLQLIFITEFFRINKNPTNDELFRLENWFWKTSYSNYFTIYSLSQQRKAFSVFKEFALGRHSDGIYIHDTIHNFSTNKFPDTISIGSVRAKALQLFMLKKQFEGMRTTTLNESIRKLFIFSSKDRSPGNVILFPSSVHNYNNYLLDLRYLFKENNLFNTERFFVNDKLISLYEMDKRNEFILERVKLIKEIESKFVESLNVSYVE